MNIVNSQISDDLIGDSNRSLESMLADDYGYLALRLKRDGIDIDGVRRKVAGFSVALPSWGCGVGGTRFARFPIAGEPTNIHEKLEDCAVVQRLATVTPGVSPHLPWDKVDDFTGLRAEAREFGLHFDAVNSNSFQDQEGQPRSYRHGSLAAADPAVRAQAIAHNIDCIRIGEALGSKSITVWVGDGSNFPGQQDFRRSFERYLDSVEQVYAALPDDWRMFIEHKLFEPSFYSTVVPDWGSSYLAASHLGPKAQCLVDLGHHAPTVNIEQIVSRLHQFGKLGGFHFNDSKYGDDDLDSGSINPFQLFLIFNELVDVAARTGDDFDPAYMIDQSHNVTDPIESLLLSAEAIVSAYAKALLVDRAALAVAQDGNDVVAAMRLLKNAYAIDVSALCAQARLEAGGAIDPIAVYRKSDWRALAAARRSRPKRGSGIV